MRIQPRVAVRGGWLRWGPRESDAPVHRAALMGCPLDVFTRSKKGYLPVLNVVVGAVSKLVRFIPLAIFAASLASVVSAISDASGADCTDTETQKQLSLMSTTLITGLASNVATLVLDIVLIVQAGLSLYWLFSPSSK